MCWKLDRESRKTRKERTVVVTVWRNEWGDQFHCVLSGKILLDRANLAKLVVIGFGDLINQVYHGQCAVKQNTKHFDRVREWDCDIIKLKDVHGNEQRFLFGSNKYCFCLFTIHWFSWSLFCVIHFKKKCLNNSQKWFSEECTWMFWGKMLLKSWVVCTKVVIKVVTIMLEAKGVVVQIRRWTGQALGQNLEEHNWRVWQDGMRSPHNSTPQSTVAWQLWMNISWWVACDCECVSPKGSHTMPGQHSQTRLLLVQGCMHIHL